MSWRHAAGKGGRSSSPNRSSRSSIAAAAMDMHIGIECEPGLFLEYVAELKEWIDRLGSPQFRREPGHRPQPGHRRIRCPTSFALLRAHLEHARRRHSRTKALSQDPRRRDARLERASAMRCDEIRIRSIFSQSSFTPKPPIPRSPRRRVTFLRSCFCETL